MRHLRMLAFGLVASIGILAAQPAWAILCYPDVDGDGFGDAGDPGTELGSCGSGFVDNNLDCDDTDPSINPAASEFCNSVDDDCDGNVDEDPVDGSTWYEDADADGFGSPTSFVVACANPGGYVTNDLDCDDTDGAIHPGAAEICNGLDDDCDGNIDENPTDGTTWYEDADADGFGNAGSTTLACSQPSGYVTNDQDCDDTDASIHPGADEHCNGLDDDCDTVIDEDPVDATTWYDDADSDGYGNPTSFMVACTQPAGHVDNDLDCDDTDGSIHPGAPETCNGLDDDCDATIDEDPTDGLTWYADNDADGFGDAGNTTLACSQPTGYVTNDQDCDDTDNSIHPGADEHCNGLDDDCDAVIDEDPVDGTAWYPDSDADGYGTPSSPVIACSQPVGFADNDQDCDDSDNSIHPGADEHCNGLDDDCDAVIDEDPVDGGTFYADLDGDNYGDAASPLTACTAPSGYVSNDFDCDDTDAGINPDADEVCDSVDNDCDNVIDEGCELCPVALTGDVDESSTLTSADIIYLVGYVFKGGAAPLPCPASGDVDCSGTVTSGDIIYMVGHVFKGGPAPCDVCTIIPGTWSCP